MTTESPPPGDRTRDTGSEGERRFLEGPQRRGMELVRTLRIVLEFVRGFRALHFVGPCVTVFGSARFREGHAYYAMARAVGGELARAGFTVMNGGGPGIMEAVSRGAKEAGGRTVGCTIDLPQEQDTNTWLDRRVDFHYFFVRKVMLVKYSYGFMALPGGFGTMDEIFEAMTLIQTGKIHDFPIVLMGVEYWQRLLQFLTSKMIPAGTIEPRDVERLVLTDDPSEAVAEIRRAGVSRFGLRERRAEQPRRWLGEGS